jgi:hypothetical protein
VQAGHISVVDELVRLGADLDAVDERENTPLHAAAEMGNEEMVKALVRHGCSVRIFNWLGKHAQTLAHDAGHHEIAKFLAACEHRVPFTEIEGEMLDMKERKRPPGEFRKDWTCPACGATVFAHKQACFKCSEPKPRGARDDEEIDGVSPMNKHLLHGMKILQEDHSFL